jgi:hypothetical protein
VSADRIAEIKARLNRYAEKRKPTFREVVGSYDAAWNEVANHSAQDIHFLLTEWNRLTAELAEAQAELAAPTEEVGPHAPGSPEYYVWLTGHHAGYKSERRMWQHFTGCKYPQDVPGRFVPRSLLAERDATITQLDAERAHVWDLGFVQGHTTPVSYKGRSNPYRAALDAEGQEPAADLSSEEIVELTDEQRIALPVRYHKPRWDGIGVPHLWVCQACWGDGWATQWPCKTATEGGRELAEQLGLDFSW